MKGGTARTSDVAEDLKKPFLPCTVEIFTKSLATVVLCLISGRRNSGGAICLGCALRSGGACSGYGEVGNVPRHRLAGEGTRATLNHSTYKAD